MSVSRSSPFLSCGKVFDKNSISLYSKLIPLAVISSRASIEQRQAMARMVNCPFCEMFILHNNRRDDFALNIACSPISTQYCVFNSQSRLAVETSCRKCWEEIDVPDKLILHSPDNNFNSSSWESLPVFAKVISGHSRNVCTIAFRLRKTISHQIRHTEAMFARSSGPRYSNTRCQKN